MHHRCNLPRSRRAGWLVSIGKVPRLRAMESVRKLVAGVLVLLLVQSAWAGSPRPCPRGMGESEPAEMVSGAVLDGELVSVGESLARPTGARSGVMAGNCDHASRELQSPRRHVSVSVPADGAHDDHCACGVRCHAFCSSPGGVVSTSEPVRLTVFTASSIRHEQAVDLIAAPLPRLLFRPPKRA